MGSSFSKVQLKISMIFMMSFLIGLPVKMIPEENINTQELKEILKKSLTFLNKTQAMLIQLYYVEELNIYEIAKILEISTGRVSQIKSSAIKLIRSKIEDELSSNHE